MSKTDDIREFLENEIVMGHLGPGSSIDEHKLAADFKVSRTPVREALLQLASHGLVDVRQGRRATIAKLSIKQIGSMMEVVTELEGLAAGLAARRMLLAEREALQEIHKSSRAFVEANDIENYFNVNRTLHEAIYNGCRNEFLASSIRSIRSRMRLYRLFPFQRTGRMSQSYADHEKIVDAIVRGDQQAADGAMQDHMAPGGQLFADLISELPT